MPAVLFDLPDQLVPLILARLSASQLTLILRLCRASRQYVQLAVSCRVQQLGVQLPTLRAGESSLHALGDAEKYAERIPSTLAGSQGLEELILCLSRSGAVVVLGGSSGTQEELDEERCFMANLGQGGPVWGPGLPWTHHPVAGLADVQVVEVTTVADWSLLRTADGTVMTWGRTENGPWDSSERGGLSTPTRLASLAHTRIVQIAAGVAVSSTGQIWQFGADGEFSVLPVPDGAQMIQVSGARLCGLAVSNQGVVYSWRVSWKDSPADTVANVVSSLAEERIRHTCTGDGYQHFAVTTAGELYAWGVNELGLLGTGDDGDKDIPVRVAFDPGVRVLRTCIGNTHSVVLTEDGEVYTMGGESDGGWGVQHLGHVNYRDRHGGLPMVDDGSTAPGPVLVPTRVEMLRGTRIVEIAASRSMTLCRAASGKLITFGDTEDEWNEWAAASEDGLELVWPERRKEIRFDEESDEDD